MKKTLLIILTLFCLVFSSACPTKVRKSDIEKAFKYNAQISNAVAQSAIAVGDLYDGRIISYETKEKIVVKLRLIQKNNDRVLTVLSELKKRYREQVPPEEISALDVFFSQSVITPLAEILQEAGVLSADKAEKIYLAIAFLKQVIFTISNYFGSFSNKSVSFLKMNQLKEIYAE